MGLPPGVGIAGVATIGYAGFLAGPPLIGLVAEATSLRLSMLLVTLLVSTLIFTAQAIQQGVAKTEPKQDASARGALFDGLAVACQPEVIDPWAGLTRSDGGSKPHLVDLVRQF